MSVRRLVSIGPIVLLLPACGYSARIGPQVAAVRGDPALQVSGTIVPGFTATNPQTLVGIPLTVAAGARLDGGGSLTMVETGLEFSQAFGDSLFGTRFGFRGGGITSAPGGGYFGVKGGPVIALEERHGTQSLANVTFEGFANLSTATPAMHTYGICVSIGTDYYSTFGVPHGRPLRADDGSYVAASARRTRAWASYDDHRDPDVDALTLEERERLGARWLEDARMEHASIATFARISLDLLALGAPPELVEGAHRAALDESKHARICYAMASAYLGESVGPDELPVAESTHEPATLERVMRESMIDGCVGEATAAALLRARARREKDPIVRRALRSIARDEARHAKLAEAIVAWCQAELHRPTSQGYDPRRRMKPVARAPLDDRFQPHRDEDAEGHALGRANALCSSHEPRRRAALMDLTDPIGPLAEWHTQEI